MAEVIGAIASVIGILTATIHAYDKVQGVRDLPEAFLEVGDKLPLVITTLEKIKVDAGRLPSDAQDDINKVIGSCAEKARKLQLILAKLRLDGPKPFDLKSYVRVIKSWGRMWGKNGRVEDLVKKIMDDVTLLAQSHAVSAVDQDLIANLKGAIENLDEVTPSAPDEMLEVPGGSGVSHGGIGDQFNFGDNTRSNFNTGPGTFQLGGTYYNGPDPEEACKEALGSLITDPEADKRRIEGLKGGLQTEVFQWILETSEFKQWHSDPERRLLWIKGDPGKGKTMLICGIINTLREATSNIPVAFFFLQAADQRINNAISLLLCLIYRLITLFPSVIRHFRKKYDYSKDQLFQGPNAWYSLEEIMNNILQDPDIGNAIIIIDGLDECVHNRKELLHFINQASSQCTHIKWVVSSRNWLDIEQGLHSAMRLSLELNEKSVATAVELYVVSKVRSLAENLSEEASQRITTKLLAKAQGTFLWVALVCQELSDRLYFPDSLEAVIEKTPPGLDALYSRMMEVISGLKERERIQTLLAINLAAYRPLALMELASLVPSGWSLEQDTGRLQRLIRLCGSFLTITVATVSWVHQSARDYLLETFFKESATRRAVHWVMCQGSLESMLSAALRQDIYGLTKRHGPLASGIGVKGFEEMRPSPDPLASIAYSCIYWAKHLEGSCVSDDPEKWETVRAKVKSFLETRFIYWLEALSILRHVPEGAQSMQTLLSFIENLKLQNSKVSELFELVREMWRFLLVFRPCITQWPLQVYTSGLLMSPDKNAVRNIFSKDLPKWISLKKHIPRDEKKPKATEKGSSSKSTGFESSAWAPIRSTFLPSWNSCLQTLNFGGNNAPSVTYSPNNVCLASWLPYLWDLAIKVWDVTTGEMLYCLRDGNTKGYIQWVAFSPDSTKLVVVSEKSVSVWDATNGKQLQAFNVENLSILSAALSHHGSKLILVSLRGTVTVWDLFKAKWSCQFETGMDDIWSVAFSPNRRHIAIRTADNRIFQWDLFSAQKTREIELWAPAAPGSQSTENGFCFAFTHDSNNLVVWRNSSFEVYDVATGRRCSLERSFAVASTFAVDHLETISFSNCGLYLTLIGKYRNRDEFETRVYRLDNGQQQFKPTYGSGAHKSAVGRRQTLNAYRSSGQSSRPIAPEPSLKPQMKR
ncbi:hypothetical protein MAPG_10160 [Magnaporthiopsis poae ATCC 64411]|uniref:NACHT domain-containing protein n=1 Tax=Magnaporthiopsis poae (strain ATCC 64411 / 73-15) TaxID=644358 RepID=A0A0C4EBV1_MAGP6|nr:hypothetical protein MAPG_10160 [Magnaporthiopsis poae ATCC 64411]